MFVYVYNKRGNVKASRQGKKMPNQERRILMTSDCVIQERRRRNFTSFIPCSYLSHLHLSSSASTLAVDMLMSACEISFSSC